MIGERGSVAVTSPIHSLVLYDGVCGLCNRLVSFLLRHDRHDHFRFAPLQSEFAQGLLRLHQLNQNDFDTVVVIVDHRQSTEHALTQSDAVLWSAIHLGGIWRLLTIAKLVPRQLREAAYNFIARRRYRIFGKHDQCPLPRPEDRHKFLHQP